MFSAVRISAVVAILAFGGSLALVAGPLAPASDPAYAPAASAEPLDQEEYAGFSGTWLAGGAEQGLQSQTPWGSETRDEKWVRALEVSDQRISGAFHSSHNYNTFRGGQRWGVRAIDYAIVNDEGTWRGQGTGFQSPATGAMHYEVLLAGEDAYEGLSALLVLSQDEWGHTFDVDGVIFPGELPEYPALGELSE